ncbi:hypothetical protein DWV00_10155 [Trinickia dinghuensis]|uniref:Uncharacterized protein n=1 Tax=Trinickia dinghuensis TaxID=2291023 RepID=A0A3D8K141_9BURK|nr:hypothetical protein DWV00_10155 [Trinickia dinghuensis]
MGAMVSVRVRSRLHLLRCDKRYLVLYRKQSAKVFSGDPNMCGSCQRDSWRQSLLCEMGE